MNRNTELTRLLNIRYPVVQAPMLGVTTPEMVAAVASQGGLGSLPVGGLSPEKTRALIRQTKTLTDKPFAVNLFAHTVPPVKPETAEAMQNFLQELAARHHLPFEKLSLDTLRFYTYADQIDILLSENIPIVSFTFGMLDADTVQALKQKGTILVGTATCVKEAILLHEQGIDVICAQGIEAGGHRGTFVTDEPLPMVGLMSLVTQIVQCTSKPVLAAGGICDGPTIQAALTLGAQGVQIGTAFIASNESVAIPAHKSALQNALDTDSALTRSFSGRWARGLRNEFMRLVERSGLDIPEYPIQNSLTTQFRAGAQQQNNKEMTSLWAGQSASKARAKPSAEIFRSLIDQAEESGVNWGD